MIGGPQLVPCKSLIHHDAEITHFDDIYGMISPFRNVGVVDCKPSAEEMV